MDQFSTKRPLVELIKYINRNSELTAQEKVVATTLALAYMWDYGFARLSVSSMEKRTSIPRRTIDRALRGLIDKKVCDRKRTGRATIYTFTSSVKSSVIVDTPNRRNRCATFEMTADEKHCREDDEQAKKYLNKKG